MSEQTVLAVLWYQYAAECRALYYQACNIARERIEQRLDARRQLAPPDTRQPAIIVDIDETVLDNSAYQARLVRTGTVFSNVTWQAWVANERALVLPGISNLFHHATHHGVEIFYVSNRKTNDHGLAHTINNLRAQGLPHADTKHVFLRTGPESKDDRRGPLLTNGVYDVILLMGDNLADFHHDFESPPVMQSNRLVQTDRVASEFGSRYIVLPNPMYGHWENALYPVNATNKSVFRRDQLRSWESHGRKR